MATIDIYRGASITATAEIGLDTVYSGQVNGEDKITAVFKSKTPLNLMLRDYITHNGLKYQILKFVDLDITHEYTYGAILEGTSYSLFAKSFNNDAGLGTFTLTGTATQLLTIIVDKINTVDSGWTVGTVFEDGTVKTINFNGDNCRTALGKLFTAFNLEVYYAVKQINLAQRFELVDDAIPLSYGENNGLYSLSKRVEGDFFTRVRGFGSTRNIPNGYRGGLERLSFSPGYVDIADAATYGDPIEIEVVFEDVYPNRTGTLTSAGTATVDGQVLADTSIDFNLADNFITGESAFIVMKSGNWEGSQFEIVKESYNNTTKSFKIRPNFEGGYYQPDATLPLASGDTYTFIGINLPNSYVLAAEAEVQALTANYAAVEPSLTVSYGLVIDPIHVIEEGLVPLLKLGQKIQVTDVPTGISANMRITSISYPLLEPYRVTATISDKVLYSEEQQIQRIVIESAKELPIIKKNIEDVKRFTSRRLDENNALVFDPDGNYFTEKIKPLSITTAQLEVGTRSQQFDLTVTFEPNPLGYGGTGVGWTSGKLNHYTVIPGSTYTWNIASGLQSVLTTGIPYYIYARCNKANNTATIILDTVARQVGSDSTYWWFLVGSVNSVNGGVRRINLSYGTTEINGAFINTGSLISQDGLTILNLDYGTFQGRLQFLSADETEYIPLTVLNAKAEASKVKTDLIKNWALQDDIIEAMQYGDTFIEGGYVKTVFLDVDTIVANGIHAATIEALDVNFVKGTIGGIEINAGSISAPKFSLTAAGSIIAVDATITGTFKTGASGVRAEMDSSGITFFDGAGTEVKMFNGASGGGFYVGNTSLYDNGLTTEGNVVVSNSFGFVQIGGEGVTLNGTYSAYLSGVAYSGISFDANFGSGKTMKIVKGLIVEQTGF